MDTDENEDDAEQYRSASKASARSAAKATGSKASLVIVAVVLLVIVGFVGVKVLSAKKGSNGGANTPTSGCGSPGTPCSAAQIAKHNKQTDCWVIYDGSYYNVTSFVAKHPGTPDAFNSNTCGHDITQYLKGQKDNDGLQHTHSQKAYDTLETYKVGPVQ